MEELGSNTTHVGVSVESDSVTIQTVTRGHVESATSLKTRILGEITKLGFPDLVFLYSKEVLAIFPTILEELLEEERQKFYKLLKKPLESLTFEDTRRVDTLGYSFNLISHLDMVEKSELTERIVNDFRPKYVAFSDEIAYSRDFYNIYLHLLSHADLDWEQKRIVVEEIKSFEIGGIHLPENAQEKIKEINLRISVLSDDFRNNLVKSKKEFCYHIVDLDAIKNLPQSTLDIAQGKAVKEGKDGYIFDADPTAYSNILDYCNDSKIREAFAKARNSFASSGEFDNRPIALEMLRLREEKAQLLSYNNYAELSLVKKMAGTPGVVFDLIGGISAKAKQKAYADVEEIKSYFGIEHLEYWDVAYYQTKLKEEKYDFDEKELKSYFEYNNTIRYLFEHAQNFYGLEMRKILVSTYDTDVSTYEVYKDGKLIAYYLLDPFYNNTKRSGAWAENFRGRGRIAGLEKVPVIVNVCNFQKSENGQTLLAMQDVKTLFHEFGHALHEMLSESEYARLSGFNVEWDFMELPSQIYENWATDRDSLVRFARHYQTGEIISTDMMDKMERLKAFMSGLLVLTQNTYALLDMNLYSSTSPSTIEELDKIALGLVNDITIFPRGEEYKIYTSFAHIFSGEYSAGYYSYMWAEILEADVFARIKKLGMFDSEVGNRFVKTILGQGSRKPAQELFFDFMGRDLDNQAFMERNGLM